MTYMRHHSDTTRAAAFALWAAFVLAVVAILAPPAAAAPKSVSEFFGNPDATSSPLAGGFALPVGIAVNSSGNGAGDPGDIYVVDSTNNRVQRFNAAGEFVSMWGRNVIRTGAEVDTDLGDVAEICTHALDCQAGILGSRGGEFTNATGVAVDQITGTVYVVEAGARVQAFTGDGQFLWTAGKDVVDGVANPGASGDSPGGTAELCSNATQCKSATAGTQGGEFGVGGSFAPSIAGGNGIAVSPVANPITGAGNVLVTDRGNARVQELTSTGGFVRAFGWNTVTNGSPSDPGNVTTLQACEVAADCKAGDTGTGVGQFASNTPNRVAVDSTGAIYTVENSANRRVQKFTAALSPSIINPNIGGSGPALPLTGTGSTTNPLDVAIGPGDHVFVLKRFPAGIGTPPAAVAERRVVELDATGSLVETHGSLSGLGGAIYLAVDADGEKIYLPVGEAPEGSGNGVYILSDASPPSVSMGVGSVGPHGAVLNGLVNPNGPDTAIGFHTRYHFEYRVVGAPGWTALSGDRDAGSGLSAVPVSGTLSGLAAGTEYEAKLVASKPFSGFGNVETAPETFDTPESQPDIDAAFVTARGSSSVTLNARINPNGEATTYRFEYGPTAAYGTTVPVGADGSAGVGSVAQIFSEAVSGLDPETTYHYRVTATSANGTARSADATFATRALLQPPDGREFELVSPADKIGGSGLGPWYAGVGSHGNTGIQAYEGDRFASLSYYGASLAEGGFSYGSDWTLGERTPSGWVNRSAFSRAGGQGISEYAKVPLIYAASDDLSLTSWHANSQLAIFPEQQEAFGAAQGVTGGAALREWGSGRWEIAAPYAPDQQAGGSAGMVSEIAPGGGHALIAGPLRGVAGAGDPTHVGFAGGPGDLVCSLAGTCAPNVYLDDVTAGLSDTFPVDGDLRGGGIRSLVNACTGEGAARTAIPSMDASGKLVAAACPAALAGRDARLISPRGASVVALGKGRGAVSYDASRVFFMSPNHRDPDNLTACRDAGSAGTLCPPQLYVRQRDGDGTVATRWISRSAVAGQDASLLAGAVFEGATPDGDKAFFRTASPLTVDDPNGGAQVPGGVRTGVASPDSTDLYMYDFPDAPGADPGDGTLTRISAGPTGAADANISTDSLSSDTGALRAFGADGSRVYFVTAAALPGVPAAANGTVTTAGGTVAQTAVKNLYLYDSALAGSQRWRFVAQLPADTLLGVCAARGQHPGRDALLAGGNGTGQTGTVETDTDANCVRSTSDGSFITFFTDGRLTADDPDTITGDVYAYDASSDELVRLSAPQGGPGGSYVCVNDPDAPGAGTLCNGDPRVGGLGSRYRDPIGMVAELNGPGDRTVFFESVSRLVPADVNDVYDVYRWRNGELALVSTGLAGAEPALYRGSDRAGRNVYVSTRDRLTWQDHDAVLDVYSAHVGGGIPEPTPPPTCALIADSCQGEGVVAAPPAAQPTAAPSSDGNADAGERKRLSVAGPSPRARRSAARSGVLRLRLRASEAGPVRVVASARIAGRARRVAGVSVRATAGERLGVALSLNRAARRRLHSGRALRVRLRVSSPGALSRTIAIRLPGVNS